MPRPEDEADGIPESLCNACQWDPENCHQSVDGEGLEQTCNGFTLAELDFDD